MALTTVAGLLVARSLAADEYGEVAYLLSVFLMLSLVAGLGLSDQVTREVARHTASGQWDQALAASGQLLGFRLATVALALIPVLAWSSYTAQPGILLAAIAASLMVVQDFFVGIFRGHRKYVEQACFQSLQPIIYLILLIMIAPVASEQVLGLLVLSYAVSLAVVIALAVRRKLFPPVVLQLRLATVESFQGSAIYFYGLTLTQAFYGAMGTFVLGRQGLFAAAALLSVSLAAVRLVASALPPALSGVYFPQMITLVERGLHPDANRHYLAYLKPTVLFAVLGSAILFFYGDTIVPLLYTDKYAAAVPSLRTLAPLAAILTLDSLIIWTMVAHGQGRIAVRWYTLRLLLLLVSGIALVAVLGTEDAAYTWSLAYLLSASALFLVQLLLLPRLTGHPVVTPDILVLSLLAIFCTWASKHIVPNLAILNIDWAGNLMLAGVAALGLTALALARFDGSGGMLVTMLGRLKQILGIAALLVLAVFISHVPGVDAASSPGCVETPGSRSPVLLRCNPGYATGQDAIEIWPQSTSSAPGHATAERYTDDATWLFRVGGDDGPVALIIVFERANQRVSARIYDDQDGDGSVLYQVVDDDVVIQEGRKLPSVTIEADDGWWTTEGALNYNLDISVDGAIIATNQFAIYGDGLLTDDFVDYEIHVRDPDQDGKPDFEWRQVYPGLADDAGFYRTLFHVNPHDNEAAFEGSMVWPWLGSAMPGDDYQKPYGRGSLPPLAVDWQQARLSMIREFVASRGAPNNYFIYSIERAKEGALSYVDFESPFAFYHLGGPNSDFPDLSIRFSYNLEGKVRPDAPVEQVNLTWRLNDSGGFAAPNWDYGMALLGRNEHTGTVVLDDFALALTPYDQLPNWVITSDWDYGTFLAVEDGEYLTTEHIYEWGTLEGVLVDTATDTVVQDAESLQKAYVQGHGELNGIGHLYRDIASGLRGEFAPAFPDGLSLYMSPVDQRLHLKWAEHGIWRLDEEQIIRVGNLDGDEYVDVWSREVMPLATGEDHPAEDRSNTTPASELSPPTAESSSTLIEAVVALPGYLLHHDGTSLTLVASDYEPALFETVPPTDRATREAQRALLAPYGDRRRNPTDLRSWLDSFPGPRAEISGASAHHLRITDEGFRFELALEPGYRAHEPDLLGLAGLAPGAYAVENRHGTFDVAPLVPAGPVLEAQLSAASDQVATVQVTVHNPGTADAPGLAVVAEIIGPEGSAGEFASEPVDALAGETGHLLIDIPTSTAGPATVRVRLEDGNGQVVAVAPPLDLASRPADPATIFGIGQVPILIPVVALFAIFLAIAAWLASTHRREQLVP